MPNHKNTKKYSSKKKIEEIIPPYEVLDGIRYILPYVYTHETHAKGRWVGRSILDVVSKEFGAQPIEYWKKAIELGFVSVNNEKVTNDYIFRHSDLFQHKTHRHEPPVTANIELVANTNDFLVVNKPSTIPVHPCGSYRFNSLTKMLSTEPLIENQPQPLYLVHRLDRLTSGVVILGKTQEAAQKLSSQIREKDTCKIYLARVKGRFPGIMVNNNSGGSVNRLDKLQLIENEEELFRISEHDAGDKDEDVAGEEASLKKKRRRNNESVVSNSCTTNGEEYTWEEVASSEGVGVGVIDLASSTHHHTEARALKGSYTKLHLHGQDYSSSHALVLRCPIGVVSYRNGVYACIPPNRSGEIKSHHNHSTGTIAKESITLFRQIGEYDAKSDTTLVECRPITGRTHQLRLHLQFLGCPIANDPCYGGEIFYDDPFRRQRAVDFFMELRHVGLKPLAKVRHLDKYIENNTSTSITNTITTSSDTINVENKTEMVEEELIQGETESQEDFISRCCVYCRTKDKANQIDKDSENEGEGGDDGGNNGYLVSGMNSESILHSDGIWLHALMYAGGIQGKETESSSNNNDDDSHTWGPFESAMPNWSWSFLKLEEGPKQNQK